MAESFPELFIRFVPEPLKNIVDKILASEEHGEFLSHLDAVRDCIDSLSEAVEKCHFQEPDTRATFPAKLRNAVRTYYIALNSRLIALELARNGDALSIQDQNAGNVAQLWWLLPGPSQGDKYFKTYSAIVRLNLLNNAWIAFESSLDALYEAKESEAKKEQHRNQTFRDVNRILTSYDIKAADIERIKNKLHVGHISIVTKQRPFFRGDYVAARDKNQDRQFLEFFGTLRNTMHNNGVSFKTADFETGIGTFSVEQGKAVDFATPELCLAMIKELSSVFEAFITRTEDIESVIDVYVEQNP